MNVIKMSQNLVVPYTVGILITKKISIGIKLENTYYCRSGTCGIRKLYILVIKYYLLKNKIEQIPYYDIFITFLTNSKYFKV